jgi:hypothetical protein
VPVAPTGPRHQVQVIVNGPELAAAEHGPVGHPRRSATASTRTCLRYSGHHIDDHTRTVTVGYIGAHLRDATNR